MTLEFLPAHVIRNLSAKQIEDIEEVELRKKIIDGQIDELNSLIESNKSAIEAVKTEYFVDTYTSRKTEIEKHLETLSPQVAYAYLVNYKIELSKDAPADDDYSGLSRHYRKQIDLLKSGDVRAFVALRDKYLNAKYFSDFCLRKLLSEYKKRAAALPDPTGSGPAGAVAPGEEPAIHPNEIVSLVKKGSGCTLAEIGKIAQYIQGTGARGLDDEVRICIEMNSRLTSAAIGQIIKADSGNIRNTQAWKTRK